MNYCIEGRLKSYIQEITNACSDMPYNEQLQEIFNLMMKFEDFECIRLFGKRIYDAGKKTDDEFSINLGKEIKDSAARLIAKIDQMNMDV